MSDLKPVLEKISSDIKSDIASLRTGRATSAMVEDLSVEAYGAKQPLKALAAISTPNAREISIQPWDKSLLAAIEKAIQSSPLGLAPIADKDMIRLSLPPMTEERKRDLVKVLKEKLEASRIHLRRVRDDAMKEIERREKAKEISEDQRFREKQDIEKTIADYNKKIDELGQAKEREIMNG